MYRHMPGQRSLRQRHADHDRRTSSVATASDASGGGLLTMSNADIAGHVLHRQCRRRRWRRLGAGRWHEHASPTASSPATAPGMAAAMQSSSCWPTTTGTVSVLYTTIASPTVRQAASTLARHGGDHQHDRRQPHGRHHERGGCRHPGLQLFFAAPTTVITGSPQYRRLRPAPPTRPPATIT